MKSKSKSRFKEWGAVGAALLLWASGAAAQGTAGTATVEFTHSHYTVRPSAHAASITLRRTGNTNIAVSVDFATADETAKAGTDYTAKNGPVNFAAGQTAETIDLPLLADAPRKVNKAVRLTLSNPTGGVLLGT